MRVKLMGILFYMGTAFSAVSQTCSFETLQSQRILGLFVCPKFSSVHIESSEGQVGRAFDLKTELEDRVRQLKMDAVVVMNLEKVELVSSSVFKAEIGVFSSEDQTLDHLQDIVRLFSERNSNSELRLTGLDSRQPMVFLYLDAVLWSRDFSQGRDVLQHLVPQTGGGNLADAYKRYQELFQELSTAQNYSSWRNILEKRLPDQHLVDWTYLERNYSRGSTLQTIAYAGWGSTWLSKGSLAQAMSHNLREALNHR